jgi:uncharacterized phiE125 gp8 family phage protein
MPLNYRYELSSNGTLPITLESAKKYLKIENSADNEVIQDMIAAVVQFAERYTGRDMRAKTWKLVTDCFEDRILLRKSEVATVTSVKYLVDDSLSTIADTVYYLKKGHQFSEVVLRSDQVWPTDLDAIESGIEIIFVTQTPRYIEETKVGTFEHLAFLYANRGDCDVNSAALKSGATEKYDQGRIPRI